MELLAQIEEKIRSGMKSSCEDTLTFLEDESQQIGAEYLLTVNVAKKLAELNKYIGQPYKIYLERKTRLIARDCVPLFGKEISKNPLGIRRLILSKPQNTSRNGKADIALYYSSGGLNGIPLCVIELKGFDTSRASAVRDLKRNAEYFKLQCRTGKSQIQYTCFAAMHSFPKSITEQQIAADLTNLKTKYEGWQAQVGLPFGVSYQINVSTISSYQKLSYPDPNYQEFIELERNHHFAGVIVSYGLKI